MDQVQIIGYLEKIDAYLETKAELVVYGSAAFMLLGEVGRTSLDIDVAGPYCQCNIKDVHNAATAANLPVNPVETYSADHIEWIGPLRLCLPPPVSETEIILWQGDRLIIKTVSPAELIASKLIRYDESDQSDIRFLYFQSKPALDEIKKAVRRLPGMFRRDPVVSDNYENLKVDIRSWTPQE